MPDLDLSGIRARLERRFDSHKLEVGDMLETMAALADDAGALLAEVEALRRERDEANAQLATHTDAKLAPEAECGCAEPVSVPYKSDRSAVLEAALRELHGALSMFIAWDDDAHDTSPAVQHDAAMKAARSALARIDSALSGEQSGMVMVPAGAIADVAAERLRQIEVEGWSAEHDDAQHGIGELARAAACYCAIAGNDDKTRAARIRSGWLPATWPWDPLWWKPKDRRRDLVRAGALIIAEIELLDRRAASSPEKG